MIFKCKNCGGNTVFDPGKGKMVCPHCESEESQEKIPGASDARCVSCGAPLDVKEYTSACKCPNCGSYHILEERIEGDLTPHLILPFTVTKEQAADAIRQEFKKRIFTPKEYLSQASIQKMEGIYVPFFMYDFHSDVQYRAIGTRVNSWTRGDYKYTETSYYDVARDMEIDFCRIPVDASLTMEDSTMDLLEPYNYSALKGFEDKYMSGFLAERYSDEPQAIQQRAKTRAQKDSKELLSNTLHGYATLNKTKQDISLTQKACEYALLPVWVYEFQYFGKTYTYYVNGQTKKVIGRTPIAYQKVAGCSALLFAACMALGSLIFFGGSSESVEALSAVRANTESQTQERVFDYADVLTDEEEASLRQLISQKETETRSDIAVITLNESLEDYVAQYEESIGEVPMNQWVMVYADNFADENKLGFDKPYGDSMVFLDNWYREADGNIYSWMSTSGRIEDTFTQSTLEGIMEDALAQVDYSPYQAYYDLVTEYADTYLELNSPGLSFGIIVVISFLVAGIFLGINCFSKKGKKTINSRTYVAAGKPRMRFQEDRFLRKSVSKVKISSESSSGGGSGHHISSGGHSHGGGGHSR